MKGKKSLKIIKRYQLEHLIPLALTIISIYFWVYLFKSTIVRIVGLIINILGLIVWWAANFALGENWNIGYGKPKIKNLVTNGIYSKIRHPLYWGINLTLIGLALIYLRLWLIIIVLIIVIYFFKRMDLEMKYLTKKLGKKYIDYKKNTWI